MRSSPVLLKFLVPFFMVLSAHTAAVADGDPVHGATVFKKCASCHEAGRETNKMGPHLKSLIGRPAGSVSDFRYSAAMKDAGAAAMVWDEKTPRPLCRERQCVSLVYGARARSMMSSLI
jgi:cytochrome c